MFVREKVSENDKELYEKIVGFHWHEKYSDWITDRQQNIFIVASGKCGVETPVIFYMCFKQKRLEFRIWEADYRYKIIDVIIPSELKNDEAEIESVIRCAYHETNGLTDLWSLPAKIDDCTFEFKII